MEFEGGKVTKPKRVRKAPYRKWSEGEQQQLITFMRENRPLEKPTAQAYYKRFLEAHELPVDWSLVRLKARHLRQSYVKARTWQNSMRTGAVRDDETPKNILSRMCPFYDELEEIFGYRDNSSTITADVLVTEGSSTLTADIWDASPEFVAVDEGSGSSEEAADTSLRGRKKNYSRIGISDELDFRSGLVEVKNRKLEFETKIKERELVLKEKEYELQHKKFLFEKEKTRSEERIKILELVMKEKVSMKELEIRERIEMEKIKMQK